MLNELEINCYQYIDQDSEVNIYFLCVFCFLFWMFLIHSYPIKSSLQYSMAYRSLMILILVALIEIGFFVEDSHERTTKEPTKGRSLSKQKKNLFFSR